MIQLAKSKTHLPFFTELSKANGIVEDFTVTRRKGLHVTLDMKLKKDMTESKIKKILDKVTKSRVKEVKQSKNEKKPTKQKATA